MPKGKRTKPAETVQPKPDTLHDPPRDSAVTNLPSNDIPAESETRATKGSRRLNLRQQAFLRYLTDPDSPSYDNQALSYARAYGRPMADNTARANGSRALIAGANVAEALRQEIERQGLGSVVRVAKVSEIVDGRATTASESRTYKDPATGEVVTKTVAGVRPQDRLRALALLDKWDGTDARRQAESQARGTLLKGLADRLLRELSPPTDTGRRKARKAGQGATQGASDADTHAQAGSDAQAGQDAGAGGRA